VRRENGDAQHAGFLNKLRHNFAASPVLMKARVAPEMRRELVLRGFKSLCGMCIALLVNSGKNYLKVLKIT
jgi:hypothetical protein